MHQTNLLKFHSSKILLWIFRRDTMDILFRNITTESGSGNYNISGTATTVYDNRCDVNMTYHYVASINFLEWFIPLVVVSIIAIVANILTIAAIVHAPQGKTVHEQLITSLAVSDCCVAIYFLLDHTLRNANFCLSSWSADVFLCYTVVRIFLYSFPVLASLLNLLALAVDHYVAIVNPLHYNRKMTSFRTKLLIHVIWIFSLSVGSLEIAIEFLSHLDDNLHVCEYALFTNSYIVPYIVVVLEVFILIFLYAKVCLEFKKFVARRQASWQLYW